LFHNSLLLNNKNYNLDNIKIILIWQFIKIVLKFIQDPNINDTAYTITYDNINHYLIKLGFKKVNIMNEEYWDKPEWMQNEDFW